MPETPWETFAKNNPDRVRSGKQPGGARRKKRGGQKTETVASTGRDDERPAPKEHDIQKSLFQLAAYKEGERPALKMLYATPNGQYRPGQRKEPGLKSGVPDMTLPVPRRAGSRFYHGLYLELKRAGGRLRPQPRMWLRRLRGAGYAARVAWGHEEAWTIICDYLDGTLGPPEEI